MAFFRVLILKLMFISLISVQFSSARPNTNIRSLDFEDCGISNDYDLVSVRVSSCDSSPCKVPMGYSVLLTADFRTEIHDTNTTLKHEAYWILYSINTKATISPESCDGKMCPFKSMEGFGFSADLTVNKSLPVARGTLYWRVQNMYDQLVMCFKLPISVVI